MADIAIFRINYKSDFILTLNSDAGWMTPFCIKFWTGAPSQAYFARFDGTTYTHCAPVDGEPTKLRVQFDDHHLPIGDLKFQIGYHFTVADFPTSVEDEVLNQASVIIEVDDAPAQVMLDLNGETAPEIEFSLPAYANEVQRIANEEQRIAAEQQRIANEESRIAAETIRQQNEQKRIDQETARVNEFATLKSQSQAATRDANAAATLANEKAQLAADKAALADDAATLAIQKAQLAADKAALANDAAQLAADKAALAQQKAEYAQQQGSYAKDQGDYAKNQGNYAKEQGEIAQADHERAEADHGIAVDDHTQAGNDHTRAEADHGIAADDHTQAGNDHTRAESDHGIVVDDHTQAGNDHTRAESDHGIAADDHTQAGNDHTRAESDHTRAESDHTAIEPFVDSLGAFDISAYNATGGVLAKYADLTAALGTNGANIPEALRKGGMSVKYVQTYDNKYVQWRYMGTATTGTPNPFLDTANWQGVDDEPTAESDNLVKSGGVKNELTRIDDNIGNLDELEVESSIVDDINLTSISVAAMNKLCDILEKAVYTDDQRAAIAVLRKELKGQRIVPPTISLDDVTVTMSSDDGGSIYYTLDGTRPTINSQTYSSPIDINDDTLVKAIVMFDDKKSSVTSYFAVYPYINFEDSAVEAICLANFDVDRSGVLTKKEARKVTVFSENLFRGNTTIQSFDELRFFTGLESLPTNEFYNCSNLTKITLPDSLTSIGKSCFANCAKLTRANIPDNILVLEDALFGNCAELKTVVLNNKLTSINKQCFQGCSLLELAHLPDTITTIGISAFNNCHKCNIVKLPESLMTIGSMAFYRNSDMSIDTIPASVTSIGEYAFAGTSITKLKMLPTNPPTLGNTNAFPNNTIFYIPDDIYDAGTYQNANVWSTIDSSRFKKLSEF